MRAVTRTVGSAAVTVLTGLICTKTLKYVKKNPNVTWSVFVPGSIWRFDTTLDQEMVCEPSPRAHTCPQSQVILRGSGQLEWCGALSPLSTERREQRCTFLKNRTAQF